MCGVSYNIFTGANVFVIRSSSISERSAMFTRVTISFAIGTALGPAINWPLSKVSRKPSTNHVDFVSLLFRSNHITFIRFNYQSLVRLVT